MFEWFKHAFAVESLALPSPNPAQAAAIDRVCRELIRREMTLPAQMVLDSSAPLSYMAGQSLRFFEPFLIAVLNPESLREFASFLEHRKAVEYISQRLQQLSADSA